MDFQCTNGSASVALQCNPKVVVLALLQKSVTLKCNTKSVTLKVQRYSRSARRRNELRYIFTKEDAVFKTEDRTLICIGITGLYDTNLANIE